MDYDKDIKWGYLTASAIVCKTPCWVFAIIGVSDQTTGKVLTVRDGAVVTSPIKLKLICSVYDNPVCIFDKPIFFEKGLYLQLATNVVAGMVQYKPIY